MTMLFSRKSNEKFRQKLKKIFKKWKDKDKRKMEVRILVKIST